MGVLDGKVVLVTGASSGLGEATAKIGRGPGRSSADGTNNPQQPDLPRFVNGLRLPVHGIHATRCRGARHVRR